MIRFHHHTNTKGKDKKCRPISGQLLHSGEYPLKLPEIKWVQFNQSEGYPVNMVSLGKMDTDEMGHIGRVSNDIPAIILKTSNLAHVTLNGLECKFPEFETMTLDNADLVKWKRVSLKKHFEKYTAISSSTVNIRIIGRTDTPLGDMKEERMDFYIKNITENGKVQLKNIKNDTTTLCSPSYINYCSRNIIKSYEILIRKASPSTLFKICCWNVIKLLEKNMLNSKTIVNNLPIPNIIREQIIKIGRNKM